MVGRKTPMAGARGVVDGKVSEAAAEVAGDGEVAVCETEWDGGCVMGWYSFGSQLLFVTTSMRHG
jgi:hypothetical protein